MILSARFEEPLLRRDHSRRPNAQEVRGPVHRAPAAAWLLALEYGATRTKPSAALLHDAAEDAGGETRLADIRMRFGAVVASIVADCTDTCQTPKPPWRARKEAYIAHLPQASRRRILVSCCDKLTTPARSSPTCARSGPATWEKFSGGRDGSLWYYRTLADYFAQTDLPRGLIEELAPHGGRDAATGRCRGRTQDGVNNFRGGW